VTVVHGGIELQRALVETQRFFGAARVGVDGGFADGGEALELPFSGLSGDAAREVERTQGLFRMSGSVLAVGEFQSDTNQLGRGRISAPW
jgi:hypothetical protein